MTVHDTSGKSEPTTQPEEGDRPEFPAIPRRACQTATDAQYLGGSMPSDFPAVAASQGGEYVFRVIPSAPLGHVTITLDSLQLVEQARVRSVNHAIRRAR